MLVIGQHGNGQRVRKRKNGVGGGAVASQVIQNDGKSRATLRTCISGLPRRAATMDVHGVGSYSALQVEKEDSFAALRRFFGEPMPCGDCSQNSPDSCD